MGIPSAGDKALPPEKASAPDGSALTYRDVQTVLALVDSWRGGHVRFVKGDLHVEAVLDGGHAFGRSPISAASRFVVRSPAVGIFHSALSPDDAANVDESDAIGMIVAPGRTTPVTAGARGTFAEILVGSGEFVEYGQALAAIRTK